MPVPSCVSRTFLLTNLPQETHCLSLPTGSDLQGSASPDQQASGVCACVLSGEDIVSGGQPVLRVHINKCFDGPVCVSLSCICLAYLSIQLTAQALLFCLLSVQAGCVLCATGDQPQLGDTAAWAELCPSCGSCEQQRRHQHEGVLCVRCN